MERQARWVVIVAVSLMWCSTVWGADQAAPKAAPPGPMQKAPVPAAPGMTMPAVAPKIVISPWNLTADNNWPESDTRVTLTFQIKNHGQGRVENIPWAIHDASVNRTLKTGTQAALAPGETVVISTVWQPGSGGSHLLQAYVDPSGTALKNTATQTVVALTLVVPAPGKHILRIGLAGVGRGRVTGWGIDCADGDNRPTSGVNTCFVEVPHGATVQLAAYPDRRNTFSNWSNNCTAIPRTDVDAPHTCHIQVNASGGVVAAFALE